MTPLSPELPLRDIHLPAKIGFWPLAPGWWALLGLLILAALGTLILVRYRQRRRYKRLALAQLEKFEDLSGSELAQALSRLLRRAAICHFPHQEVAGLTGDAWLEFLDRPFADDSFSHGPGHSLGDAPYRLDAEIEKVELLALCRNWLNKLPPQPLSFWRGR